MDPHFSGASPLDGETRFFYFKKKIFLENDLESSLIFVFYFKMGERKTLNVTPDKKMQVWENRV